MFLKNDSYRVLGVPWECFIIIHHAFWAPHKWFIINRCVLGDPKECVNIFCRVLGNSKRLFRYINVLYVLSECYNKISKVLGVPKEWLISFTRCSMRMLHSNILCILSFKSTGCSIRNSLVYMIHSFKIEILAFPGKMCLKYHILFFNFLNSHTVCPRGIFFFITTVFIKMDMTLWSYSNYKVWTHK